MAAGQSPFNQAAQAQLVQRLAQMKGAMPGGGGGPEGGPSSPDAAGAQLSQQMSELAGADPQMLLKVVKQIKSMLIAVGLRAAFQVPDARRNLSKAEVGIDGAIKDFEKAAATLNSMRPPIANSAGIMSPQPGQDNMAPGGSPFEGL